MPQGKGTYGSKVGRPSKKYPKGGMLNGAPHEGGGIPIEAEGGEFIIKADSVNEETLPILEQINDTGEFPTTNAMDRSQTSPDVTEYKEGGKIEDWKEEGYEWSTKELKRRIFAQERGTDITDLVKLRSRRQKEVKKAKKGKKK